MATTSVSLGSHWEAFIREKVDSGRYGTATEVLREALRMMEEREKQLAALRAHLAIGEAEADQGIFVEDFSMEKVIRESDAES